MKKFNTMLAIFAVCLILSFGLFYSTTSVACKEKLIVQKYSNELAACDVSFSEKVTAFYPHFNETNEDGTPNYQAEEQWMQKCEQKLKELGSSVSLIPPSSVYSVVESPIQVGNAYVMQQAYLRHYNFGVDADAFVDLPTQTDQVTVVLGSAFRQKLGESKMLSLRIADKDTTIEIQAKIVGFLSHVSYDPIHRTDTANAIYISDLSNLTSDQAKHRNKIRLYTLLAPEQADIPYEVIREYGAIDGNYDYFADITVPLEIAQGRMRHYDAIAISATILLLAAAFAMNFYLICSLRTDKTGLQKKSIIAIVWLVLAAIFYAIVSFSGGITVSVFWMLLPYIVTLVTIGIVIVLTVWMRKQV